MRVFHESVFHLKRPILNFSAVSVHLVVRVGSIRDWLILLRVHPRHF